MQPVLNPYFELVRFIWKKINRTYIFIYVIELGCCGKTMAELFLLMVSLFSLSIDITLCSNRQNEEYKCCVPEEWRGTVFLSSGSSLTPMNLTLYTNGTALLAYNIKLDKLYLGMEVIHQSPQLPQPLHTNWTILYDFTKVSGVKQMKLVFDYN